ncbi:hypothetical protein V1264_001574 [Littorina saxatilis]|uniref:Uncharacterized protein n=2 Tax=Littorina saxatilis TaxID=31220 RepID=A0AAN9GP73_9CAEN
MSRSNTELLPSSRIRCDSGRIRVGERSYFSASDALSAYLQQFDGKQSTPIGSSRLSANTSQDAFIQKSAQGGMSPVPHSRTNPANVTGLLTGSPRPSDVLGGSLNNARSPYSSQLLNGDGSAQRSSKHSVSFTAQDSTMGNSLGSPRQQQSSGFLGTPQGSFSTSYATTHYTPSNSLGLSHLSATGTSLPHHTLTSSSDFQNRSLPQSNGFPEHSLPVPNGVVHNGYTYANVEAVRKDCGVPAVGPRRAKSEIEVLLTAMPSQKELETLTQDALREAKLTRLLKKANNASHSSDDSRHSARDVQRSPRNMQHSPRDTHHSSNSSGSKSSLQQEVEDALNRSGQLLENIKSDPLVSPRCVSDIGSLNTDILLSINPYSAAEAAGVVGAGREGRSRHRYSYYTPAHHTRSRSVGPVPSSVEQHSLRDTGRRRSVDSLGPQSSLWEDKALHDLNQSTSLLSDSQDILKRLQNLKAPAFSDSTTEKKETKQRPTGPPSWIEELVPPSPKQRTNGSGAANLEDTIFSERGATGGRHAPSWVNGLDQSDIASSVDTQDLRDAAETLAVTGLRRMAGVGIMDPNDNSSATDLSYAGPGLSFSDLVTSPSKHKVSFSDDPQHRGRRPARVSRNNSFSGVSSALRNSVGQRRDADRSKPPLSMNRFHQDLAGVDVTNLSSSVGADSSASILRKKVCKDSAEAKRSMDRYLSGVNGNVETGRTNRGTGWIPRCSSVDSINGIGRQIGVLSDVTGASPIPRDSNLSSKLCLDDPTLTPARQSRGLGLTQQGATGLGHEADQDLLDGDRPWEAMMPSFKAPVHVDSSCSGKAQASAMRPESPTLSGGQQPGSMEALKQMLFRLQTEETSTNTPSASQPLHQNGEASELIPALKDYDFEVEPGGQSLERALVHLGRLKTLVQTGTNPSLASATGHED